MNIIPTVYYSTTVQLTLLADLSGRQTHSVPHFQLKKKDIHNKVIWK